jgi:hypothetical protein
MQSEDDQVIREVERVDKALWDRLESSGLSGEDAWVAGFEALDRFRFSKTLDERHIFDLFKRVLSAVATYNGSIWRHDTVADELFAEAEYQEQALEEFLYYNYKNCTNDFETILGAVRAAEIAAEKGWTPVLVNCMRKAASKLRGAYGVESKLQRTFEPMYEKSAISDFLALARRRVLCSSIPHFDALERALQRRLAELQESSTASSDAAPQRRPHPRSRRHKPSSRAGQRRGKTS